MLPLHSKLELIPEKYAERLSYKKNRVQIEVPQVT